MKINLFDDHFRSMITDWRSILRILASLDMIIEDKMSSLLFRLKKKAQRYMKGRDQIPKYRLKVYQLLFYLYHNPQ